jgi:ubiquinone/menaquinone biosynthesis C-methylase UbiE
MTYNQKDGTKRWDNNAERWHRLYGENDPNRHDLLDPIILEILGNVKEKRVLDAGCGDGYMCRKLAKLGATVTGVEISQKMLAYAIEEQKHNPLTIDYHHADCSFVSFLSDSSFDVVVTNNVIQDMADYENAFKEFSRLLKPGSMYLHIENHPCFTTPILGWVKNERGEKLYRKVDYYFNRGPFLVSWRTISGMVPSVNWHRTLGDIMNALIDNGLSIKRVIEPEPPEIWKKSRPEFMDGARIPDFIVIVCQREK